MERNNKDSCNCKCNGGCRKGTSSLSELTWSELSSLIDILRLEADKRQPVYPSGLSPFRHLHSILPKMESLKTKGRKDERTSSRV